MNTEQLLKRADGKPFINSDEHVSVSHHADAKMLVKSQTKVGCDVEQVNDRDASTWNAMLGKDKTELAAFVSTSLKESISVSSTRLWGAMECLKKSGDNLLSAISLDKSDTDGFVIFKSGNKKVISYCAWLNEFNSDVVFSVLI